MPKKVTLDEINESIKQTDELLNKLKMQLINPGLPLHLAPKGKKKKSRTQSKPKSRTQSKPKLRTQSKKKIRSGIQSKKDKIIKLGVDPRQLFGLDNDELEALLENPQLIQSMAPYNFQPPDDSPRPSPLGIYDYPPGDDPNNPTTLKRTTARRNNMAPPPGTIRPRFG